MRIKSLTLSEADFMHQVIDLAHFFNWTVAHFRSVRVQKKNGDIKYMTPVHADGLGFPDLLLVKKKVIVAELKVGNNKPSKQQQTWLLRFDNARVEAYLWYPKDMEQIKIVLGA